MHEALKTDQYKQARDLLQQGQTFSMYNDHHECKVITPHFFNLRDLRNYFKFCYIMDEPITEVVHGRPF